MHASAVVIAFVLFVFFSCGSALQGGYPCGGGS